MNLKLNDFNFDLPEHLIADKPAVPRDASKILVYKNNEIEFDVFSNIFDYLPSKSVLVFNKSKVYKARLLFKHQGKDLELFFVSDNLDGSYKCMVRPGKFFKENREFELPGGYSAYVLNVNEDGTRVVSIDGLGNLYEYLNEYGQVPLPPYIKVDDANEFESNYQTVYAESSGSVAAPTAGLHFTESLLDDLKSNDVKFEFVDLSIGLGTFAPLKEDDVVNNKLHAEHCEITEDVAERLNRYRDQGYSIISVGTTALRTLQSSFTDKLFSKFCGPTDIFIYPPFDDWSVDGLITNFHLPKSSLFILISAFVGTDEAQRIYRSAIDNELRFYSFGDSSLLIR